MKEHHRLGTLCHTLAVSPSGYYDWQARQRRPGPRALADQALLQQLQQLHQESRRTYGSPRLQALLRREGQRHGRNRIARLMRLAGLFGRQKRRYRVRTTDSRHDFPIAPNRLAHRPAANAPNQLWVADVTYIPTAEGWLYLAAVLDLYSRKIVGWARSQRNDTALVLQAWNMARQHRRVPARLLFHSDRGSQYASADFRRELQAAKVVISMSRAGNCYDNAAMESFWSTLKLEVVYPQPFTSAAQAQAQLFDYIEVFYNRQRLHSALNYLCPVDFELLKKSLQKYLNDVPFK
jgi:putative transposase